MEPVLGGPHWKPRGTGDTQIRVLLPLLPAEAPVLCHRRARAPRSVFLTAQEPWGPEKEVQKALDVQPKELSLQIMLTKDFVFKPNNTQC